MSELLELVQNYGLGIVLTVYLIYKDMVTCKNMTNEITDVKEKTTEAINNNTKAMTDISSVLDRLEFKVDHVDKAVS